LGIRINSKEGSGSIRIRTICISFRIRNACREVRQRQKEKKARGSKHEAAQIERQVKQQMEGQDPALVRQVERQLVKHRQYLHAVILDAVGQPSIFGFN
jgi:hypothetical protein